MRGSPVSRRAVQRFRQLAFSSVGSVKIKLLLGFCIVFALILFASRASTFARWKNPHTSVLHPDNDNIDIHRGDEIEIAVQKSKTTQSPPLIVKGYTLLINTWKRNDLLRKSISHYAECPRLDSIHIIWSEHDPPSESLANYLEHIVHENTKDGHETEVKFDINKEDSLNNRFKENEDLKTDVVFSIDDDVILPCSSVELAFSIWLSAPDTMVGFVPRMHWVDKSENINDHYVYGGWWSVWWMGTYSMVLSKAAFFHKKYLAMYTNGLSASIKEYIAQNRNCEDIAMSFLVANASGAPPIWVKGKIFEIGSTGISSLGGHSQKRTECVNRFAAEFGRMPLVSTTIKVVDSRNTWFW